MHEAWGTAQKMQHRRMYKYKPSCYREGVYVKHRSGAEQKDVAVKDALFQAIRGGMCTMHGAYYNIIHKMNLLRLNQNTRSR